MNDHALFFHDLRAPLARARTYGKLLLEEHQDSDLLHNLLLALEELETKLRTAENKNDSIE